MTAVEALRRPSADKSHPVGEQAISAKLQCRRLGLGVPGQARCCARVLIAQADADRL